jgi:hypothetical protein
MTDYLEEAVVALVALVVLVAVFLRAQIYNYLVKRQCSPKPLDRMRRIIEQPEKDLVQIDGFCIDGWLEDGRCQCAERLIYYERYDALFCPKCNAWRQERCGDPNCGYCPERPPQPLPE